MSAHAKLIAFFNHQGGVRKRTNVFYVGRVLAELGHTVLLADGDPQCNLSGVVISQGNFERFESFYRDTPDQNVRAGLRPVYEGELTPLKPVASTQAEEHDRCHPSAPRSRRSNGPVAFKV